MRMEFFRYIPSHGKGPCDGIGGTVKRMTVKASLQRPTRSQIVTPKDMYDYCRTSLTSIQFLFVSEEDVHESAEKLKHRFASAVTVKGTQRLHRFNPISQTQLEMYDISSDTPVRIVQMSKPAESHSAILLQQQPLYQVGTFIACVLDGNIWIGVDTQLSTEFGDYRIKKLHPRYELQTYHWPHPQDTCWVPLDGILSPAECNLNTSAALSPA